MNTEMSDELQARIVAALLLADVITELKFDDVEVSKEFTCEVMELKSERIALSLVSSAPPFANSKLPTDWEDWMIAITGSNDEFEPNVIIS